MDFLNVRVEVGVKVEVLKLEKFKKKLKSQEMRFPKSKTMAADNTSTNTTKTCCPVHPTKMGKIKTLEANPDGTGPQIWEDASSSTYITRQAGTQFSVR